MRAGKYRMCVRVCVCLSVGLPVLCLFAFRCVFLTVRPHFLSLLTASDLKYVQFIYSSKYPFTQQFYSHHLFIGWAVRCSVYLVFVFFLKLRVFNAVHGVCEPIPTNYYYWFSGYKQMETDLFVTFNLTANVHLWPMLPNDVFQRIRKVFSYPKIATALLRYCKHGWRNSTILAFYAAITDGWFTA